MLQATSISNTFKYGTLKHVSITAACLENDGLYSQGGIKLGNESAPTILTDELWDLILGRPLIRLGISSNFIRF
jgi:hypothetical protein